jgi:hypothetical protein
MLPRGGLVGVKLMGGLMGGDLLERVWVDEAEDAEVVRVSRPGGGGWRYIAEHDHGAWEFLRATKRDQRASSIPSDEAVSASSMCGVSSSPKNGVSNCARTPQAALLLSSIKGEPNGQRKEEVTQLGMRVRSVILTDFLPGRGDYLPVSGQGRRGVPRGIDQFQIGIGTAPNRNEPVTSPFATPR